MTARLFDEMFPPGTGGADDTRHKQVALSDPLKLAEQYQASFGRQRLEDLAQAAIPDPDYLPGPLHHRLLRLPWADVLTTNYDTLLERAADEVYERRYDVVRTVADIPRAIRPRIVKLHGSFPSHRPYILTAEDFRTYTRAFAGFVNLAQQVAMEAVLCLIGFSGDDPNFLEWTGWVRDHLRADAPRIYLCGVLDADEATRLLLDRRNVTPVDLAAIFPSAAYPDRDARHRLAADWLFRCLELGRAYDPFAWPEPPPPPDPPPDLPDLVPDTRSFPDRPVRGDGQPGRPVVPVEAWCRNRLLYPGWVIAPRQVRRREQSHLRDDFELVRQTAPGLSSCERLRLLAEYDWRLETCLLPLWEDLAPLYRRTLDEINPFPAALGSRASDRMVYGRDEPPSPHTWATAREDWMRLAAGLLRHYREERRDAEFDALATELLKIRELLPERRAFVLYQRCLFAMERLDDPAAHAALAGWPADAADPMWTIRRAAAMAELGDREAARDLAQTAVVATRARSRVGLDRVPDLSREGWAMRLAHALNRQPFEPHDQAERDRYRVLNTFGCDPRSLLADLDVVRADAVPTRPEPIRERVHFQPGQVSVVTSGYDRFDDLVPAYEAIRLAEEAGYPPSDGNVRYGLLAAAAIWLQPHDPVRTQSLIGRLRQDKLIEQYLNRHRVAALPADTAAAMAAHAERAVRSVLAAGGRIDRRDQTPAVVRTVERLEAAVAILSRVLVRLPPERIEPLWPLACELYSSAYVRDDLVFPDELKEMFASLMVATDRNALETKLILLARLPIPGTPEFPVKPHSQWPDLLGQLRERVPSLTAPPPTDQVRPVVGRLLESLGSTEPLPRQEAATRLLHLRDLGLLLPREWNRLVEVFWAPVRDKLALPEGWQFYTWVWLTLPPDRRQVTDLVRKKLLPPESAAGDEAELNEDRLLGWLHAPRLKEVESQVGAVAPVQWGARDARVMLRHVRNWWQTKGKEEASRLRSYSPFGLWVAPRARPIHHRVMSVLSQVVIPLLRRQQKSRSEIVSLVHEMAGEGVAVGEILPWLAGIDPTGPHLEQLSQLLADPDPDQFSSAVRGLSWWVQAKSNQSVNSSFLPDVPPRLLQELGQLVGARKWPGLTIALNAVADVVSSPGFARTADFNRAVLTGLKHLLDETAYRLTESSRAGGIPYDYIPRCRQLAGRVAAKLYRHGHKTDPIVRKWLETLKNDPLPEARRLSQELDGQEE
ncbi:MAG: SIR2 family protein [Gemmataceae bacterium]